jgi:hypothetical protein
MYLLGYRRHHSICYTGLFTTPLVVVTISLLQWVLTLWCLSLSGPLISSSSECWQLTDWLALINWLLAEQSRAEHRAVAYCRQPASTVTPGIEPRWDPWPYICSMSRLLYFFSVECTQCGTNLVTQILSKLGDVGKLLMTFVEAPESEEENRRL